MMTDARVVLLDEIAAHLDRSRREALFDRLLALGAQAWLTGTDHETFASLGARAQFFAVAPGRVLGHGPQADAGDPVRP